MISGISQTGHSEACVRCVMSQVYMYSRYQIGVLIYLDGTSSRCLGSLLVYVSPHSWPIVTNCRVLRLLTSELINREATCTNAGIAGGIGS